MLVTQFVNDNFKMLVTVLAISVTNILYLFTLASGTNKDVTKILILSPTF